MHARHTLRIRTLSIVIVLCDVGHMIWSLLVVRYYLITVPFMKFVEPVLDLLEGDQQERWLLLPYNRGIKQLCLFSKLAAKMGAYFHGGFIFMGC